MRCIVGWDIGGAHVKAARVECGEVVDAMQWPCPLWQGLEHLDASLASAALRWRDLRECRHAVTMSGEMVDLFAHRQEGVAHIAARLDAILPAPRLFAVDGRWRSPSEAAACWAQIASANWLATARHCAAALGSDTAGLLVDIGSTTTDITAFRGGSVVTRSCSDAQRLRSGELVYHGVVRTPLCALAQRIAWRGAAHNVMNEFFATTADVYRTTGELDALHDQQPAADQDAKDAAGTHARLARMIGLDARDGSADEWLAFAQAWRAAQCDELRGQIALVAAAHGLAAPACVVAAGCGAFLVPALLPADWRCLDYASDVARVAGPQAQAWTRVAAPAAAVALLLYREEPCSSKSGSAGPLEPPRGAGRDIGPALEAL
jgi:probable H4MPT-linked C1 transfer pathway protein